MLALSEKQMLINALGKFVVDEVQTAVAPFIMRLANVEKMIGDMPVPRDGIDGKDGKDAVIPWDDINEQLSMGIQMLSDQLDKKIAALPKPGKGEKGDKGDPGEPGKDGKDGRDGADGKSIALDDVRVFLSDLVRKFFAEISIPRNCVGGHIDRAGHLFLRFSDGGESDLGEVAGKDGRDCDMELVRTQVAAFLAAIEKPKDGKDGLDGVGFDDLQLEFDGQRDAVMKFIKGEVAKVFNLHFAIPLDRGIWKSGSYEQADMVQRDGSTWIAEKDTNGVPGLPNSGWRLCTKRGRDGKDGKQGPEGPQGKPGRDGRDLTQLGLDGSKW